MARSKAAYDYEKFKHLTFHPQIIHPHSRFRVRWEMFILMYSFCQMLIFFQFWSFVQHDTFLYQCVLGITYVLRLADTVIMFYTGYVEDRTEIVVLDPKKIAKRYLFRTFIFDVLSIVPVELIVDSFYTGCITISAHDIANTCQLLIFATVAQFSFRIPTALRYLKNTFRVKFWNPFMFRFILILVCFLLISDYRYCYVLFMSYMMGVKTLLTNYMLENIYEFVKRIVYFFMLSLHNEKLYYDPYSLIGILSTTVTFVVKVYLSAYFFTYIRFRQKTQERFYILESNVRTFARKWRLPYSLKLKTYLYFNVFVESKHYKENEMFNYFPETFKKEVFSHLSIPLLMNFYAFEALPIFVLRRLAEYLRYQLYLPNDIVMMKDDTKLRMYFIHSGSVALYGSKDIEIYHFEDGTCFNGKAFISGKIDTHFYAISLEVTEIYTLDYENFMEVMTAYPELLENIKRKYSKDWMENQTNLVN